MSGPQRRALQDDPRYEIGSGKTDHIAARRGRVLGHVRDESDA